MCRTSSRSTGIIPAPHFLRGSEAGQVVPWAGELGSLEEGSSVEFELEEEVPGSTSSHQSSGFYKTLINM